VCILNPPLVFLLLHRIVLKYSLALIGFSWRRSWQPLPATVQTGYSLSQSHPEISRNLMTTKWEQQSVGLGIDIYVPQPCHWGSLFDVCGLHSLVCKQAPRRPSRHSVFNFSKKQWGSFRPRAETGGSQGQEQGLGRWGRGQRAP